LYRGGGRGGRSDDFISSYIFVALADDNRRLILKNAAPVGIPSGSPVASIPTTVPAAPGTPFWAPDLYQRTSDTKEKRGSILSRGTLVICPVSLVGQVRSEFC